MTDTCETCKFFRPEPPPVPKSWPEGNGDCHRYPPDMDGRRTPVNKALDCGEYTPNSAETANRLRIRFREENS